MKKLTTSLTFALLAMTAMTSTASAQSVDEPYERYDYNRGVQLGASALAGAVGAAALGGGGFALASSSCEADTIGAAAGCSFGAIGLGALGAVTGGLGGGVFGAWLTGGARPRDDVMSSALLGGAAGALLGIPLGLGATFGAARLTSDDMALFAVTASVIGLSSGVGAALGYQNRYRAAGIKNVTLAPMITPEHSGVMVTGRF